MPLVRVEVRNEYGLGMPELYTEVDREDPKAVLDGVAVAGLVGILRQLGDLAEFAAEIFHGLQEQVLITSSRSHKLVQRVHNIEASLPPLEKAILAQRSHLHFAYTAGSHWHTRLRTEQNHFIYSDLPRCIMDSYEDCRDPPRLHKLDKFDIGGSGSCFKRYSDPTYFKRTSAGPYEAHLQNVPRQKKARRNKKKRSSSRYRDVTHDAPVVMQAGRTDFGSQKFEEKSSPSQDVPTFHVPQKSGNEPEVDRLTSFDARNGSGYIECIFRPSYSSQSEDNSAKEPSSDINMQHTYFDENIGVHDETIHNDYLAENSSSMSPYITWDEKLEIIDSTGRPNEAIETSCKTEKIEISCKTEKLNTEEEKELNSGVLDHIDFDFHDEQPLTTSIIVRNQPDEIESETDFYMDALNTIESESETDMDCHTKRELQQYSSVNENDVEELHKDDSSMNFEFHVPEGSSSSQPKSISPASQMEAYVSLTTSENLKSEEVERLVMNEESLVSSNGSKTFPSVSSNEPESQTFPSEQILSTQESPEPSRSTSGGQTTVSNPVMFWTNGGLLGLEPSKPPDFGLATAAGPVPVEETKTDGTQHLGQKNTINGRVTCNDSVVNASKSESADVNGGPVSNDDLNNSSRIFEFSNRLLVNGFRKQISLVGNEKLASSVKSDVPENTSLNKVYQPITGIPFREQFGNGNKNLLISPSSPPLEHMRISFQPIDGFETSKLKLMLPDGNNNSESNGHMFPSFQLVPEPSTSLHESGSDSDDDTFCRSSPYASDDCHSNPSESNSEQWDSSDSPRIKDGELDDAFGRISSAESVSGSLVNGTKFPDPENYGHQNGVLFDIPTFDSFNGSHNQVTDKEPTPPPPPLPPMEWRGVKPHPEDALSDALTYALNLTPPEPPVPRQPKPAPTKQDHFVEMNNPMTLKHKTDWQNLHVQSEPKPATNGKVGDEKEDFLQQIRTKSMNLRPTSTARTTTTPAGPNSIKVTAIIEKASAIRQAVGSDDGEDNWSDT